MAVVVVTVVVIVVRFFLLLLLFAVVGGCLQFGSTHTHSIYRYLSQYSHAILGFICDHFILYIFSTNIHI